MINILKKKLNIKGKSLNNLFLSNWKNEYLNTFLLNKNIEDKSLNNLKKNIDKSLNEYKKTIFYPSSSKEWFSSVYSYNKSYVKLLISYNFILNKLIASYCNMLHTKIKTTFKRRRHNRIRYSANKIYASRAELKHTNTKVIIMLYTYNKKKLSIERYIRKLITLIEYKRNSVKSDTLYVPEYQNRLIHTLKNKFFIFQKWNMSFFKIDSLLKYLLLNLKRRYLYSYKIPRHDIRLLKKLFKLQKVLFNSIKRINFNKFKFNNLNINLRNLGLIPLIQKIYNKKVEIQLIELKSIHLNSDIFSSSIALKLRDRKNNVVEILRKAILQMVKIPDLHTLITFDDRSQIMDKNNIVHTIKQQVVSGVRFEASGRLTRRLTAMRAVFKYRYAGGLKNIRSSLNRKPSTMLRGYAKCNSQYTIINSKTRNGTFGLKGWVSSH